MTICFLIAGVLMRYYTCFTRTRKRQQLLYWGPETPPPPHDPAKHTLDRIIHGTPHASIITFLVFHLANSITSVCIRHPRPLIVQRFMMQGVVMTQRMLSELPSTVRLWHPQSAILFRPGCNGILRGTFIKRGHPRAGAD